MLCERCGKEGDVTTTDRGPCMVAHCGECFWDCSACLSDLQDDIQGELF